MMMLMLKLVLQVLAVASALLIITLDYVAHDKRTRWFKNLRVALFVVVGLSLVAGIVVTVADEIAKREEVASLRAELAAIRGVVKKTEDAVTGGTSFPYVNILGDRVLLINEGSDPLYDISGRMWDPKDYTGIDSSVQFEALESRALHFKISSMPPNSAEEVGRFLLPELAYKMMEATILARNGSFSEQLVLRHVGAQRRVAYRVFRGMERKDSEKLLERADPIFPRDQKGELLWNEP